MSFSQQSVRSPTVDMTDVKFAVFATVVTLILLYLQNDAFPALTWTGETSTVVGSFVLVIFIFVTVKQNPQKLDDWGLGIVPKNEALIGALVLLVLMFAAPALIALSFGGDLYFNADMITRGLAYLWSAFAQEFLLCSLVANNLARVKGFQGQWRVPLLGGLLFGIMHFFERPAVWPATGVMMTFTAIMGFVLVFYFLRYRSLWPIVIFHAGIFPLHYAWINPIFHIYK